MAARSIFEWLLGGEPKNGLGQHFYFRGRRKMRADLDMISARLLQLTRSASWGKSPKRGRKLYAQRFGDESAAGNLCGKIKNRH